MKSHSNLIVSPTVPLIRASMCEPIIMAAHNIGTPVDKLLNRHGLPTTMLDNPNMLVPEIPIWNLIEAISQLEGEPLFGLKAISELTLHDTSSLKPLLCGYTNLKLLLDRICQISPTQSNISYWFLEEEKNIVWLKEKSISLSEKRNQVELFVLAGMVGLVQLAAGEKWNPPKIHLTISYDKNIANSDFFNPCEILFSQPNIAIAIPRKLLALNISLFDSKENRDNSDVLFSPDESFRDHIRYSIKPYIGNCGITNKLISTISGMSIRTIQRKLSYENTSYIRILNELRFDKARYLLEQSDEKLIDIALSLGYDHSSSFSRAFKEWAGISPREYRFLFKKYT